MDRELLLEIGMHGSAGDHEGGGEDAAAPAGEDAGVTSTKSH